MLLSPWECNIYVLILGWKYFSLSSFLQFCYWFRLSSWYTTGDSTEKHFSDGKITFMYICREVFGTPKFVLNYDAAWLQEDYFLEPIDKALNPCNVFYPEGSKGYFLTHIYICYWLLFSTRGVTRCSRTDSGAVVTFLNDLYGSLYNKETWREEIFLKRVAITASRTLLLS